MPNFDSFTKAFSTGAKAEKDLYRFGTVKKKNADRTVNVQIGTNAETKCTCLYSAEIGDRVQVCIKANGKSIVLGRV